MSLQLAPRGGACRPQKAWTRLCASVSDEEGASAIEFALVFPLLFFLLYGAVHYGFIFAISSALTSAANDAARAAIQVDPEDPTYETLVVERARAAAVERLAWLGDTQKTIVLGTAGDRVSVALESDETLGEVVRVVIAYPSYSAQPVLPVVTFPVVGPIPPLPDSLGASAVLGL